MKKAFLKNKTGLHARPASQLVQIAQKFQSNIKLSGNNSECNAKSIMGILALGILGHSEIEISADGVDAHEAEEAIRKFIEDIED